MSKIISVSNEVYSALKARKNGRSFSEVIMECYSKTKKTPLDVLKNLEPNEGLANAIESCYLERKNRKLKRVVL